MAAKTRDSTRRRRLTAQPRRAQGLRALRGQLAEKRRQPGVVDLGGFPITLDILAVAPLDIPSVAAKHDCTRIEATLGGIGEVIRLHEGKHGTGEMTHHADEIGTRGGASPLSSLG